MVKLWIISPGGVGCTYFIDHLNKYGIITNKSNNYDGLKHFKSPPLNINSHKFLFDCDAIIYLVRHPQEIVESHFRRRWGSKQSGILGGTCKSNTFSEYLNSGDAENDSFGINNHFESWINNNLSLPFYVFDLKTINLIPQILDKICNCTVQPIDLKESKCRSRGIKYYEELWIKFQQHIDSSLDKLELNTNQ